MEYALFLGLLTLALLGAITLMSGDISDLLTTLANRLANSVG
jgi:Flp pilus assembly pilin Flp